jgi:flagellar export protein FliJ
MGFQFSLASVLRLRELAEEREERLLQNIQSELARASENLNSNAAELKEVYATRDANGSQLLLAADLHSSYGRIGKLSGSRNQLIQQIEKLKELKSRQMITYRTVLQDREALDQIRDQKRFEHDTQAAKRERNQIDDTFGAQWARKRLS